jgi:hypothetical protein
MTEPTATPKAKPKAIDWDVFEFFPNTQPNKTPIAEPMAIPDPAFPVLLAFILQMFWEYSMPFINASDHSFFINILIATHLNHPSFHTRTRCLPKQ